MRVNEAVTAAVSGGSFVSIGRKILWLATVVTSHGHAEA